MRRSNRVKWSELKVGILILFASGILMWASLTGGGTSIFDTKKLFKTYFRNVNGLTTGSPVWVAGVEVGNVRSIRFVNLDSLRRIEIVGSVKSSVWPLVTNNSYVKIGSVGLIGDKYVELVPGDATAPHIEEGGVLESQEDEVGAIFRKVNSAIDEYHELSVNLNGILRKVNKGEGTLGRLLASDSVHNNLVRTLESLSRNLRKFEANQDRAFASVEKSAQSLEKMTNAVTDSSGTFGKLLYDSSLYTELTGTLKQLHSITASVDSGNGTLGALVKDKDVYLNTKDLIARLESLLKDMEKNPKKYFKFSMF